MLVIENEMAKFGARRCKEVQGSAEKVDVMECDDSGHVNEDSLDNTPAIILLSVHSQYSRPSHIIFGDEG